MPEKENDFTIIIPTTEADYKQFYDQSYNYFKVWNREIIYAYGPKDPPIAVRLYNALMKAKTEFIVLCAIDDILFLSAIEGALTFLVEDIDPKINCFSGQFLRNNAIMYPKLKAGIFDFDAYWNNYTPSIWGIHRTAILKQAFSFMKQFKIGEDCKDHLCLELVVSLFDSAKGFIIITEDNIGIRR